MKRSDDENKRLEHLYECECYCGRTLDHPHIRRFHDSGREDRPLHGWPRGIWYIVLEWVEFGTLRNLMNRDNRISPDDVRTIIANVGAALQHAHDRDIVHRDVKPENVLLPEGQPAGAKLIDFGIAAVSSRATRPSMTPKGTAAYMAPEQTTPNAEVDGRADQFSLALVCWELLTGRREFDKADPRMNLFDRSERRLLPSIVHSGSICPEVSRVLTVALSLNPNDRFRSMHNFVESLTRAGEDDNLWSRRNLEQLCAVPEGTTAELQLEEVFGQLRLTTIDNRQLGGALWVVGGRELKPIMDTLRGLGVRFHFKSGGGRATRHKDSWWTADSNPLIGSASGIS
jgi:serine/threonine protein kinase